MANSESRGGTPISLVIIHTTEGNNPPDLLPDRTAEDLVAWMERECAAGRGKSYQAVIDDDSVVRQVPDDRAAWSARSANRRSLNLCFTGWARWTRSEWLQHPSMLERGRHLVRVWCDLYDIPLARLTPIQVRARQRGVIGHVDWSNSNLDDSDHSDPGEGFPWDVLLGRPTLPRGGRVHVDLLPTIVPVDPMTRPGPAWLPVERTISVIGPVKVIFGYQGAWVQEAWWKPSGQHIVDAAKPVYIDQFIIQRWTPPAEAEFLVLRYASRSWGAVKLV